MMLNITQTLLCEIITPPLEINTLSQLNMVLFLLGNRKKDGNLKNTAEGNICNVPWHIKG